MTATVEIVKNNNNIKVARITYITVDVDYFDKLAPPISRLCWDIGRKGLAFEDF